MAKKPKYVTDDYINKVEHYINNDLPLLDLYDDTFTSEYSQRVVDSLIKKGEKYIRLKGDLDHVVLTSYGRLINTKRVSQYSLRFTVNTLVAYVSDTKIDCEKIFEEQQWDYNVHKIRKLYDKYKWIYQDTTKYKYYADPTKLKKKRAKTN